MRIGGGVQGLGLTRLENIGLRFQRLSRSGFKGGGGGGGGFPTSCVDGPLSQAATAQTRGAPPGSPWLSTGSRDLSKGRVRRTLHQLNGFGCIVVPVEGFRGLTISPRDAHQPPPPVESERGISASRFCASDFLTLNLHPKPLGFGIRSFWVVSFSGGLKTPGAPRPAARPRHCRQRPRQARPTSKGTLRGQRTRRKERRCCSEQLNSLELVANALWYRCA